MAAEGSWVKEEAANVFDMTQRLVAAGFDLGKWCSAKVIEEGILDMTTIARCI